MRTLPVELHAIEAARRRICETIKPTPVVPSPSLSEHAGVPVHLKLEHQQITGSFKLRGAANAVAKLDEKQMAKGVVGVSTGNHGRGLAHAAAQAGISCIVCMSELVPANKIDAIRQQGAEVRITGKSQDEAQVEADRLVHEEGMTLIPPFDHADVIAGQGTLGLELCEEIDVFGTLIVPLSGGGLISGIAAAVKSMRPQVRIVGVSMRRGAAMHAAIKAGEPVFVEEKPTLADSLGGGIGLENRYTFEMVRALVDDIVLLGEDEIADGVRHAYWHESQIVEGAGAVGIAAILSGRVRPAGPIAVLLSGGNIDLETHYRIVGGERVAAGDI